MQSSNSSLWRPSARTVLILYLSCTACTSWRPDSLTPQAVVAKKPLALRVTRTDSSQVVLDNPQMQGDTIVGLGSVLLTETRRGDVGKSLLVLLGIAVVVAAVVGASFASSIEN